MPDTINFTVNETVDNIEITVINEVVEVNVIRQSGGGGGTSDLSLVANPTNNVVSNTNGTGFTIAAADGTNAGLLKPAKFSLLELTTEAFTTALKTAYDSAVTFISAISTATVPDSTNKRYVTDTNLTKINAIDQSVSTAEKATWNGKQATLVSGTNIKTINGNTVLGSGDLVIAAAGELSGKEFQMTTGTPSGLTQIGIGISVITGTTDAVAPNFTNAFLSTSRRRIASAATAGSSVIFGDSSFRKVALGSDYTSYFIFGNEDATFVADARFIIGYGSGAGIGNVNPSNATSFIGIGADSGDTQISIFHNYGGGLATKITLGVNFPSNTSATDLYIAKFQFLTSGGVTITVGNLSNGASVVHTITTNIQPIGTSYFTFMQRNNGSTALAVRMSLIHWSVIRNSY